MVIPSGRAARTVLALLAALVLGTPVSVDAHGALRSSRPAAGSRLAQSPRDLVLEFNERVEAAVTTVSLADSARRDVPLGDVRVEPDGRTVIVPIGDLLPAGRYTVRWRTVGRDGHPVNGTFRFTVLPSPAALAAPPAVGAGADTTRTATDGSPPPAIHDDPEAHRTHELEEDIADAERSGAAFDAESPGFIAVRWATLLALVTMIGAVAFRFAILPRVPDSGLARDAGSRAARLGLIAAGLLVAAAFGRLFAQSAAAGSDVATLALRTSWGVAWFLHVGGAAIVAAGLAAARQGRDGGWTAALPGAVAAAYALSLSGHAVGDDMPFGTVAINAAHILGASAWLGSLFILLAAGLPATRRADGAPDIAFAGAVNAFSPVALASASVVGATGLVSALLRLDAIADLWRSDWGRTLLLKLALLVVVVGLGAWNWRRVRPTLGAAETTARLSRSARAELAFGAIVLLVTAILVGTPLPNEP